MTGRLAILTDRFSAVFLAVLLAAAPYLAGCADSRGALVEVEAGATPFFVDFETPDTLLTALDRQIAYLAGQADEPSSSSESGAHIESLARFRSIIARNPDPVELNRLIRDHFHLYQAAGRSEFREMLVTGYYEPMFNGSLRKTARYRYPLHSVPASLVQNRGGQTTAGRIDETGRFQPFWTRAQIEGGSLLQDSELVYHEDRLDAYLLQVQGSGRIRLEDGRVRALHFAASNGHPYRSLGKLLVDRGVMEKSAVSVESIRAYFDDHPEQLEASLFHNPRYIFFAWGDDRGPRGSIGQVLTPQRSIALDRTLFPAGTIGYLVSSLPALDEQGAISHWRPIGRFVLPQDSGAAITGPGRVDLFMGSGYYAEKAAGHMNESGSLFFLLPRKTTRTILR